MMVLDGGQVCSLALRTLLIAGLRRGYFRPDVVLWQDDSLSDDRFVHYGGSGYSRTTSAASLSSLRQEKISSLRGQNQLQQRSAPAPCRVVCGVSTRILADEGVGAMMPPRAPDRDYQST